MRVSTLLFLFTTWTMKTSCQPKSSEETINAKNTVASIIGGTNATENEFPFLINIWQNSPQDNFVDHLCGASLIHPKWVLTAAHCLLEDVTDKTVGTIKLKDIVMYIGSNKISGQGGRALKAKSILIHPQFSWPHHDVALLELVDPVTDVTPVSLNQKDLDSSSTPLFGTVAGWGLVDSAGKQDGVLLQKITLPLLSRKACAEDPYLRKKNWPLGPDVLCAETFQNTKSSCPGDSGGPLFQFANGAFTQIGIVSWGFACRPFNRDNEANVDGYADVSDAYPWIQSIIK